MASHITIRTANVGDLPTILDFIKGLAEYERLPHEVVATTDVLREELFGPRPSAEVLLASVDGTMAGFALFFYSFSTFLGRKGLYLEDLFVRSEFRGRGVGKALLRDLSRLAVEQQCGRFEWSVLDWNEQAIRFYESLGARPMKGWTEYRLTGDALHQLAR